jgi:hypothetical protein
MLDKVGKARERKQKQIGEQILQSGSKTDRELENKIELEKTEKGSRNKKRADTEWERDGWVATEQDRMGKTQKGSRKKYSK